MPKHLENDLNVVVSSAVVDQINIGKEKQHPLKWTPSQLFCCDSNRIDVVESSKHNSQNWCTNFQMTKRTQWSLDVLVSFAVCKEASFQYPWDARMLRTEIRAWRRLIFLYGAHILRWGFYWQLRSRWPLRRILFQTHFMSFALDSCPSERACLLL